VTVADANPAEQTEATVTLRGRRRALLFGCNDYADSALPALRCARADVDAMQQVLADPKRGRFEVTVLAPEVSHDELLASLQQTLSDLGERDTFLLYFSGHAFKDQGDRLSVALTNTDTAQWHTAVALIDLITYIDNSKPERIVLIFDCCFSGAIQKSFREIQQTKDLWIIAASTSEEAAYEKEGSQHSIMTGFLLDGLRSGFADLDNSGEISVSEAYVYAERLTRAAFSESTRSQEPTIFLPTGSRGELTISLNSQQRDIQLANIKKAELAIFTAVTGMAKLVHEPLGYIFQVSLDRYSIEGVEARATMLTVSYDHTPNMIVAADGFECDAFFPPQRLNEQILEGRQVVEGRVRTRLYAPFSSISMIIATRQSDLDAGDTGAVRLVSLTT